MAQKLRSTSLLTCNLIQGNQMKNIVTIENHEAKVSVLDIASFSGVSEKAIISTIRNNSEAFSRFGNIKLALNVSHMHRLLNEAETTFLLTLMKNTKEVVQFKSDLVFQFYQMREFVCETNKLQLKLSQAETKRAQSNKRKTYKDGFMSLTKYINDNDLNMKQSEAFEILNSIGAIEYQETTVIRAVLVDETLGRQIDFGVIEFNSRALDGIFNIKRPATLFED